MKYFLGLIYSLFLCVSAEAAPPPGFVPSGTQLFPCAMTRYSAPLKLSGMVGVTMMNLQPHGRYHGWFAQLEAGAGGGKVSAGWRLGKHQFFPVYNLGAALSFMRTWGNPLGDVEPGLNCLGIELSGAVFMFGLNGGIYRDLGDGEEWIHSVGVGVGI